MAIRPRDFSLLIASTGVSYGVQRWFRSDTTPINYSNIIGISLVNSVIQIASVYFIGLHMNKIPLSVVIIGKICILALYFFSSTLFNFIHLGGSGLAIAERLGKSIITGGRVTGFYVVEFVSKVALGIAFALGIEIAGKRWDQLKENITIIGNHLANRYAYYTFPRYTKKEELQNLSTEEVEAARVHFVSNPYVWDGYSLSIQLAFNLILKEKENSLIPLTAQAVEEDIFTSEELEFYSTQAYLFHEVTSKQAQLFFDHNIEPPEFNLTSERLPQVKAPEASKIALLSDAQIQWYHQIFLAEKTVSLSKMQFQEFAKRFFDLNLYPPSESFNFDMEIPTSISGYFPKKKVFYFYFYCKAGRHARLSLLDRVRLNNILARADLSSVLPDLATDAISTLPKFALEAYRKQYSDNCALWELEAQDFRRAFNVALSANDIEGIHEHAWTFFQDGCSTFFGGLFGMRFLSDKALMGVEYDPTSKSQQAYLKAIPDNRVNFLHPSMIPHLPNDKIAQVRSPDQVREIPKKKLYFIHPGVVPILTTQQRRDMEALTETVSELNRNEVRLLLCPWFVQNLSEERIYEVNSESRQFLLQPLRVSPFQRAFFSIIQASACIWDRMELIKENMFDLATGGTAIYPMINDISDDIHSHMSSLCRFFGASMSWRHQGYFNYLTTQSARFFDDDPIAAERDRKRMLYQFKHIIHALRQMQRAQPPINKDTKAAVRVMLDELFAAMRDCKNAWISALNNFESKRNEFCDCLDCVSTRQRANEVMFKSRLAGKLALYKKECFIKVILKAYNLDGNEDGQQTHTIAWYARELPHLNLYSGYTDKYPGVSMTTVSPQEMERRFMKEYTETVKTFIKNLISFGRKGDIDFREMTLDFMKGIIMREARLNGVFLAETIAIGLARKWIWDEENGQEVREGFLGTLLYSFDHYAFDPTSQVFSTKQVNGKPFSVNLDLIRNKLLQLDGKA